MYQGNYGEVDELLQQSYGKRLCQLEGKQPDAQSFRSTRVREYRQCILRR